MSEKYALALYDIRGKQDFIYKGNKIKEIMGGSYIIRDLFRDYLYPVAMEVSGKGIYHDETPFTEESFRSHLEEGFAGELIYDGGGNFFVLFRNAEIYREITKAFTKKVLEVIGTLSVLSTCTEINDFTDYKGDRDRLYKLHQAHELSTAKAIEFATIPVTLEDRRTSLPVIEKRYEKGNVTDLSKESLAKYAKFESEYRYNSNNEDNLDNLAEERGKDSLLAVVYIDGNNMGAQVQDCLKGKKSYEECIKSLREFSRSIQKNYIDDRDKEVTDFLKKKGHKKRKIVGAGDEITFICNAHDAFDCAREYLKGLPEGCSSCAGISIFHSHDPFSDAYRIAEECCESGKTLMKKLKMNDACFIDYHYNQGAIDISLDAIRDHEEMEVSRPWLITGKHQDNVTTLDDIEDVKNFFNVFARGNIKAMMDASMKGVPALLMEISRMEAHLDEKTRVSNRAIIDKIKKNLPNYRNLIYDMVLVYDLWFRED